MKFNFNPKPTPPKKTLIIGIVGSIVSTPILFLYYGIPMYWAPFLIIVLIGFFICTCLWEKKADKKAVEKKKRFLDNSYFESSEWREKYLNYTMKNPAETCIPKGMKADLTKRYRKKISPVYVIFGIFILLCSLSLIFSAPHTARYILAGLGLAVLSAIILYFSLYKSKPVKAFYQRTDLDFDDIESSYNSGMIFSHKNRGINIGRNYTIIYNESSVLAIKNSDIQSVRRHITRLKQYMNSTFAGEMYLHKVIILADTEYRVELNEYQVESVINALESMILRKSDNALSEAYRNEIMT